jgi:predicted DCC family thiol-disulfide oxidoreductase YuxK
VDPVIVLYDDCCGFCRRTLGAFLARDRDGLVRTLALQDDRAAHLLAPRSEQERMASWHVVTPDGNVHSAGAGFAPLLRRLQGGRPFAALTERFPGVTDRAYRWVAGRRTPLGHRVGRRGLERADARIRARALR